MDKKIWVLQTIGWILLVLSITIFSVIQADLLLLDISYDKITGYILAGVTCFLGVSFIVTAFILVKRSKKQDIEINLYEILNKYFGQITPLDLSNETGLEIESSKKRLEKMYTLGVCKRYITESGVIIYNFPEFEPDKKGDK